MKIINWKVYKEVSLEELTKEELLEYIKLTKKTEPLTGICTTPFIWQTRINIEWYIEKYSSSWKWELCWWQDWSKYN
jgi:hypothetical protein